MPLNKALINLAINNLIYRILRRRVARAMQAGAKISTVVDLLENCSKFTFRNNVGMFSDGRLENIALRIGENLAPIQSSDKIEKKLGDIPRLATLHVVSNIFVTGGHSRILAKWINRDETNFSVVVVTRPQQELPTFFSEVIERRKVRVYQLSQFNSIEDRAIALRLLANASRRVVLHTNPDDALPILAFADKMRRVPVVLFNHAHYWFCLGGSVASLFMNTREYFRVISERYRHAPATCLMRSAGAQITPYTKNAINKKKAKEAIGYSPDDTIILTLASEHYYMPADGYDFFRVTKRLLQRHPLLHIIFIGVKSEDNVVPLHLKSHPRIRYAGNIELPSTYYEAADIFLESFPRPSLGATIQAVALGEAFPVEAYAKIENINIIDRSDLFPGTRRATTEEEYLNIVDELLADIPKTRQRAQLIRENVIKVDAQFEESLHVMYRLLDQCPVQSCPLPDGHLSINHDTLALAAQSTSLLDRLRVVMSLSQIRAQTVARSQAFYRRHIQWRFRPSRHD